MDQVDPARNPGQNRQAYNPRARCGECGVLDGRDHHHDCQSAEAKLVRRRGEPGPDGETLRLSSYGGAGLIPVGARLRYDGIVHLEMVGTDIGPGGRRVHPLTVSLGTAAKEILAEHPHRGDWLLAGQKGEDVLLRPAARTRPSTGKHGPAETS